MKVYYYTSQRYGLDNIRKFRVKVSRLAELNDPFELLGADMRHPDHRMTFRNFKNQMNERCGVICFSRTRCNPLLWAHYADRHRGLCLGFAVPKKLLTEVQYTGKRLAADVRRRIRSTSLGDSEIKLLFATKFSEWQYEREWRLIVPLDNMCRENDQRGGQDLFFRNFDVDLTLTHVITGARSSLSKREIQNSLRDRHRHVEIIRGRLAFGSFEVVKNQAGFTGMKAGHPRTTEWSTTLS